MSRAVGTILGRGHETEGDNELLVIHAVWLAGELACWAEDSTRPAAPSRRGSRAPRRHPGAASREALASALGPGAAEATGTTVDLLLPTRAGAPLDSPELLRDTVATASRAAITLAGWQAPALRFDPDAGYALLRALGDLGVTAGAGLRHLAAVADFAADLVSRGRLLPTVRPEPYGARALWRPLLTGADAQWARSLTLALPPAVRAAAPEQEVGPLSADLLDTLVDAAARAALAGTDLAAEPLAGTAPTAWLRALTGTQRTFTADAEAVAALAAGLAQWQRDAAGAAVRGCFRLVEPPEEPESSEAGADRSEAEADRIRTESETGTGSESETGTGPGSEAGWRVEFALQPADEPGVVVDAAEIWAGAGVPAALGGRVADAQETLLAELGRASRLWPELDAALRTATPAPAGTRHRRRPPLPARRGAGPARRRVRGAAARLVAPARRPPRRPGPRDQPQRPGRGRRRERRRAGAAARLPLGAGARRRDAQRRGAGPPGRAEEPAGAAARAVGRAGRHPPRRRAAAAATSRGR